MKLKELQEEIDKIRNLMNEADDLDEIIEYDEQLNSLYLELEAEKRKELISELQERSKLAD